MTKDFDRIYNLYKNDIYHLALSYTKNIKDAEDIVQNTFIKFYKQKNSFENDIAIKKWLIRVSINECKNLFLSAWKRKTKPLTEVEENTLESAIAEDNLLEVLFSLAKKDRIVIHLYYYEDYSIKEIAKLLKTNEGTIKTRLYRARIKLKEILKEDINYENTRKIQKCNETI